MANDPVMLRGLAGLLDALKALPPAVASKNGGPARVALARGAKVIRDEARTRAPKDTGAMAANIVMKRDTQPQRSGVNERYTVGVRGGSQSTFSNTKRNRRKGVVGQKYEKQSSTFYWRFIEFGTERQPAQPFLRPAFETQKENALAVITDTLAKGIHNAARKIERAAKKAAKAAKAP